jgi:pyruvate dehydrogenase E1 component alpha subunit
MPSRTIDGMDVELVADVAGEAAAKIRAGSGPQFLECISYRFSSHSTTARETRSREELASIRSLCPIERHMKGLLAAGTIDRESEASLDSEVADIVAGALAFADASQFPDPAEVLTDVW